MRIKVNLPQSSQGTNFTLTLKIQVNLPEYSQGTNFMLTVHFAHCCERLAWSSTLKIESSQGTNFTLTLILLLAMKGELT
jgi:hypothetical protein